MTLCYVSFQTLMEKITSTVTMEVYARASRRKFTHLGGIKFDGDVRVLLQLFQTLGGEFFSSFFYPLTSQ